ncbi:MAG: hypothetical protein IJZ53_09855 [Tyzzerella sp.]|nr:hypothetical protein [Tyzzerella sp.]
MGTFAGIFAEKEDNIPESKKDEFVERIEKLYQAGGMMEIQPIQLYGKKVATIRKATMRESSMDFYYNYFEDDCWENAGFNRGNRSVWSNKIGWSHFHTAVVAAYVVPISTEKLFNQLPDDMIPDGPEYENVGLHYWGEEPRRRLMNNWKSTDLCKRNNKARVTFRRYMALVANKELRRKVFGF